VGSRDEIGVASEPCATISVTDDLMWPSLVTPSAPSPGNPDESPGPVPVPPAVSQSEYALGQVLPLLLPLLPHR
jgi:hypothetical protein